MGFTKGGVNGGAAAGLRSWWGKRWAEAVDLAAPEPKPRGRAKPRGARLRNLDPKTGEAFIEVSTSSVMPYEVRVSVVPIDDAVWEKAVPALSAQALFAAKLLAGEMPAELEEALAAAGGSLFPSSGQVRVRCNCPAGSSGCRHGALAERTLAESIDRDPFLLFDLRGRARAQVLEAMGVSGSQAPALGGGDLNAEIADPRASAPGGVAPRAPAEPAKEELPLDPAEFRRARGDLMAFHFHIAEPESPRALLSRLGDPPGWRAPNSLLEALGPTIEAAAAKAREIANSEEEKPGIPQGGF